MLRKVRCGFVLAYGMSAFGCGTGKVTAGSTVDGGGPDVRADISVQPAVDAALGVDSAVPPSDDASALDAGAGEGLADGASDAPLDAILVDAGNDAHADELDAATEEPPRPIMNRSCDGLGPICGPNGTSDCCASSLVPGGTFNRSNDPMYPATVSDFRLDLYEVNVGRFRRFVTAYPASKPLAGSGRNPHDPNDTGWDPAWPLPADQAALIKLIKINTPTWVDTPGSTENLPMNSITWFVGLAFCIWDGGRMPTEAEWNYAAAGGTEQRYYPWSSPPDSGTIDPSYAVYNKLFMQTPPVSPVGSRSPKGDGRWGHADIAGNLWEYTRGRFDVYPSTCVDCSVLPQFDATAPDDAIRGGGFYHNFFDLWTGNRSNIGVSSPEGDVGIRCAREP